MRIVAILIVLVLVAIPIAACGGSGGGCDPDCFSCWTASDCCGFSSGAVCSDFDGPPGICHYGSGSCGIP